MESNSRGIDPTDPRSDLADADRVLHSFAGQLRLPGLLMPVMAVTVTVQIAMTAVGIARQTIGGVALVLGALVVFLVASALVLRRFDDTNGARVDGLVGHVLLGTSPVSSGAYALGLAGAVWAAFESQWLLVAVAAIVAGAGYSLGIRQWWGAYRQDPVANEGGVTSRSLFLLSAVALIGMAGLLVLA